MKKCHYFHLSASLILAAPLLLTGCDTMQNSWGGPHHNSRYEYHHPNRMDSAPKAAVHKNSGVVHRKGVTATQLADPGESAVVHPKTSTAPASVPLNAPAAIPSMKPPVSAQ
jgi:hypothetical protein